jgi:cation/acetate symporter
LFGAIINFAVAYLVMKTANAPPAAIQDLVESIRVPRGAVGAIKH